MKAFRYRLDRLLKYRDHLVKMKQQELALLLSQIRRVLSQIESVGREKEETRRFILRQLTADSFWLAYGVRYQQMLEELQQRLEQKRLALEEERARVEKELIARRQEVKVLERHRQRKRDLYDLDLAREEQKFLDEVAAR